jgi:peptide deformylase
MLRKIVKYGDPVLETVCDPVPESEFGTPELRSLVQDMFETMYRAQGVGLAAPQIGIPRRLTVIDCTGGESEGEQHVLVNPEIVLEEGSQVGEEGCLSIPGFREKVKRPATVRTRARTADGDWIEIEADQLLARVICHENDHLNGVLFLQHLSRLKRGIVKRKIRNLRKRGEWD